MNFSDYLGERTYVSQYGYPTIEFVVHKNGVAADADGDSVTVTLTTLDESATIFTRAATSTGVGTYEVTLASSETDTPGLFRLEWAFAIDGTPQTFVNMIEVGETSPAYDALTDEMKGLIESVWLRFADLFDSPHGGPHLQVYFQTRFGRSRMAGLLRTSMGKLNTIAQPRTTYSLEEGGKAFPASTWGPLLEQGLYIESIKHLIRSYVEQPMAMNVNVARLDRRDYMNRWMEVLRMEEADYKDQLEHFKMAHMGLGRPRVLVSGGVYGSYGPTRLASSAAARPRYYARFY